MESHSVSDALNLVVLPNLPNNFCIYNAEYLEYVVFNYVKFTPAITQVGTGVYKGF